MKNLQKLTFGSLLVVLVIVAVLYLGGASKERSLIKNKPVKVEKIEHLISHAEINELFEKNHGEPLTLNIYPIKHSPDVSKNDFELAIYYSDAYSHLIGEEKKIKASDFKTMSKNYLSYFKEIKKGISNAPNGYQLSLLKKQIGMKNMIVYVNLLGATATIYTDSCRYPPGCKTQPIPMLLVSDSCRYPPGCASAGSNN